jgi:hypothetical protein
VPTNRVSPGDGRHCGEQGLQAERTRLAWRRTVLSAAVVGLLAVIRLVTGGAGPASIAGLALFAAGWVAVLVVARSRLRRLTDVRSGTPAHNAPARLALLTAALALASILLLTGDRDW